MIKIKINSLKETENIADYYAENDLDMRIPDKEVGEQIPTSTPYNTREPMATRIRPELESPESRNKTEEEFELDEDMLYEKKDRCYNLAKQKYDLNITNNEKSN